MKNKLKKLFLIFVITVASFSMVACNKDSQSNTEKKKITLNYTTKEIGFLDSFQLIAECDDIKGEEFIYKSSDSAICSVDKEGLITGEGLGEAIVTVKYGETTSECAVKVIEKEAKPLLRLESIKENDLVVSENDVLDLACYVLYGGNRYYDADVTYKLSNEKAGQIEAGKFNAGSLETGSDYCETDVIIKATWRGFTLESLSSVLKIGIIKDNSVFSDYIQINGTVNYCKDITLYLNPDENQSSKAAFEYKRITDGKENPDIIFKQKGDSVIYENGEIRAVREGVTKIYIGLPYVLDAPIIEIAEVEITITVIQ